MLECLASPRRRSALVIVCVGLMIAALPACRPTPESPPATSAPGNGGGQSKSAPVAMAPLLKDWGAPDAVLVLTGDEHGYMEPCGCSEKQSGGFARRGDLIRQLQEGKGWPVAGLSVGGLLADERVSYPQSRIKFTHMMQGLNTLGYRGLALGLEELMLGGQQLFTEHSNLASDEKFQVPFLGANITIFGTKDLGTPLDLRVVEVGGKKIAVIAVTGNRIREQLKTAGVTRDESELAVSDPFEVLPGLIERAQAESPDWLVLLSSGELEESKQLAQKFPEFRIVVSAHTPEDPRHEPVYVGETLLVQVGKKGKHAAVVGLFGKDLKFELVELDMHRFQNDPRMHQLMADYQQSLRNNWDELKSISIPDPSQGAFAGAESCKDCHTYAYSIWSKSKHAHALDSLSKGRPGQEANWISRIYDPECLCCHTTGWDPQRALRHESGFVDAEQSPHLAGQQCENCHGPGARHNELEEQAKSSGVTEEVLASRRSLQLTLTKAKNNLCNKCHDLDNSPQFNFDVYWPKVNHTGRKN